MSVLIEALTLVMRRRTLDASYPGGADAMTEWLAGEDAGARWVVADEHLIAASFLTEDLHPVIDTLLDLGFLFSEEDGNQDAVVVDALLGFPSFCDWLEWAPPEHEQFSVCWLAGALRGELVVPDGHTPGEDTPMRAHTRWEPHMIRLGAEEVGEAWLNTRTGKVEVHALQPCLTVPGPIMQGILEGLPQSVQGVHLTEGDAEELFGTFRLGDPHGNLSCTLRVRTFEAQRRIEGALLLPLEIPRTHLKQMHEMVEEVRHLEGIFDARIDTATAAPCGYLSAILDETPTPPLMDHMMELLGTAAETLVDRLRSVAEAAPEDEYLWLRAPLGLTARLDQADFERELSELIVDLEETGWARVRVRDLMTRCGEAALADEQRDRIYSRLAGAGLDPSGVQLAREGDWIIFTREPGEGVGRSWATEG